MSKVRGSEGMMSKDTYIDENNVNTVVTVVFLVVGHAVCSQ